MKKILISILSLFIVISLLIGCSNPQIQPQSSLPQETSEENLSKETLLNGQDISKYTVIYSEADHDYSKRAAEYIKNEIKTRTGIDINIQTDLSDPVSDYEIVVGETSRDISKKFNADTKYLQFAITADQTRIALEGDYFVIAAAAYYFIDTYITGANFNSSVPQTITINEPITKEAKNYIFLIGDGMGVYQTLLYDVIDIPSSNNYSDNEDIFYGYMFPYQGFAKTKSLTGITDSAAAGTALASGHKTANRLIGKNFKKDDLTSLTELAGSLGMSTAVMSTEARTGATPSAFSAHANDRGDSNAILVSQKELVKKYNTIINCDFNYYDPEQVEKIEKNVVSTLDKLDNNENGFFIMYEEAHIDKHSHSKDMENTFLAVLRFNQVIARFMEYAFYNPETFVLITADHETGRLLPNSNNGFSYNSADHSDFDVPVFAYGQGAELFDDKTIENIQIPKTFAKFWGVNDFGNSSKDAPALS